MPGDLVAHDPGDYCQVPDAVRFAPSQLGGQVALHEVKCPLKVGQCRCLGDPPLYRRLGDPEVLYGGGMPLASASATARCRVSGGWTLGILCGPVVRQPIPETVIVLG